MIPQEILHLGIAHSATAINESVCCLDSIQRLLSVYPLVYQRTDVSGNPVAGGWILHPRPGAVRIKNRVGQFRGRIVPLARYRYLRYQINKIILDLKVSKRVIGDVPVVVISVAGPVITAVGEAEGRVRRRRYILIPVKVEQVPVKVVADIPLRPRIACALSAGSHRTSRKPVQGIVGEGLALCCIGRPLRHGRDMMPIPFGYISSPARGGRILIAIPLSQQVASPGSKPSVDIIAGGLCNPVRPGAIILVI